MVYINNPSLQQPQSTNNNVCTKMLDCNQVVTTMLQITGTVVETVFVVDMVEVVIVVDVKEEVDGSARRVEMQML